MDRHDKHLNVHQSRYRFVLRQVNEQAQIQQTNNLKILEVGAQPFIFTELLGEYFPEAELYGIGLGGDAPTTHRVSDSEIEVRYCNVEEDEWPYEDESFDAVLMMAIIEHLFDPLPALREAARVMQWDGRFVLTTPNAVKLAHRLRVVAGINPYAGFPLESKYNRHQHEYTADELSDLLPTAGFNPEIATTNLNRQSGIPKVVEYLSRVHPKLNDQLLVSAERTKAENRLPSVYRQGITESRETHPLLDTDSVDQ